MSKRKQQSEEELDDESVEKILDAVWKNWESRRRCEKTHVPNFIKQNRNTKRKDKD
ncbi:MAG: hypothetical protein GF383_08470 [Candidatus Lokiarchaeota archaeon]|nr:hypothetical protein [Candidatus Lokiarchaeota archaeon]MBD3340407.1 hypothetical protein [Candidatus Lokiarchaeota archaeon]